MNIITEVSKAGRIQDGIGTILKLDDETFEKVIDRLNPEFGMEDFNFYYVTDNCKQPAGKVQIGLEEYHKDGQDIVRGYFAIGAKVEISELFPMFEKLLSGFPEGSVERKRLTRLLESRGLEAFKRHYVGSSVRANYDAVSMLFDILSEEEKLKRFLDYDNNSGEFAIAGEALPKHKIVSCMSEIFGEIQYNGELREDNELHRHFYLPNIRLYEERVKELYEKINCKRYTHGLYEFRSPLVSDYVIRKGDEEDFTINPELKKAVYEGMPKDLSLEEQATFIYSRLCRELLYDEGYMFKSHLDNPLYKGEFSKEHMESLVPGSKVTCYDFSRILAKFINEIPGDIEAVILVKGKDKGHFLVGTYTENVSMILDAINVERGDPTNDLAKAKISAPIRGISPRFDDKNLMGKAIRKIYPIAIGKEINFIEDYIKRLDSEPKTKEEVEPDLEARVRALVDVAKQSGLAGNELTQLCNAAEYVDYFGPRTEKAYLGQLAKSKDKKNYHRIILMRRRSYAESNENPIVAIDTERCEVQSMTKDQAIQKFMTSVWEDGERRMDGIILQEDLEKQKNPERPETPAKEERE